MHRSARAWVFELAMAGIGLVIGAFFLVGSLSDDPRPGPLLNAASGIAAGAGLMLYRRSHPAALTLVMIPFATFFALPMGIILVAVFAVGLYRPARTAVLVTGLHSIAVATVYRLALPDHEFWEVTPFLVVLDVAVVAVAMLLRSHRQLVRAWAERARQAEEGQRLRIEEARHGERERIAREMHDVLAHRISLLAVHAGALQVSRDTPEPQRQAAEVIRACAYEALEDLREVIGMLRAPTRSGEAPRGTDASGEAERPQPTVTDIPALLEQSRAAGADITLDGAPPATVAQHTGRHAYRIVQEALTNARKHAPGAPVRVALSVPADGGLLIEVSNPLALVPAVSGPVPPPIPGAGVGLIGLGERLHLAGGRLEHGLTASGEFRLSARLP